VVLAGSGRTNARCAEALAQSLDQLGVETVYLGREVDAARIAAAVAAERVDAVELCLAGGGGVWLLRDLLRELIAIGRRDVSIVVHRVQ
jgi:methylmalonyl-CoA mutase cobalamin-binding subunit